MMSDNNGFTGRLTAEEEEREALELSLGSRPTGSVGQIINNPSSNPPGRVNTQPSSPGPIITQPSLGRIVPDPPSPGVISTQPPRQQEMTADWQAGLWDFSDEPCLFCISLCCPSYMYARNLADFDAHGTDEPTAYCTGTWWEHCCLQTPGCGRAVSLRSSLRARIRVRSNIKESSDDVTASRCWACGLTQEAREIAYQRGRG